MTSITPLGFIEKWQKTTIKESAAAQSHFNDLCELLAHPKPLEADPKGTWFTFEYGMKKTTGTRGFADVFKKGYFGWEYKGKKKDLTAAYAQLQQYAPALANPPLLIVCDIDRFIIHTNWNDLVSEQHEIALEELLNPDKLNLLRFAFHEPDKLKPTKSRQQLTEEIAGDFAKISERLRKRGNDPHEVAHFVNRLIFCMFAEDIELLPKGLFTDLFRKGFTDPSFIQDRLSKLFKAMNKGGDWGADDIAWFNGGLFDNDKALKLDPEEIKLVFNAAKKDWSDIDPSIMGTLFERGLDPKKQSQLGAHYTDRDMIMKIINPVIIAPLMAEWDEAKTTIEKELAKAADYKAKENTSQNAAQITKAENRAQRTYNKFISMIRHFKVLDPACGSGNFLYLSLKALKDIEREVSLYAESTFHLPQDMPEIGPQNIYGIEINPYAAELARVSVWIGEIQWIKKHGFTVPANPVLRKLKNIVCHDALMNEDGTEYHWPKADVVVGNPPFIGDKKMIRELGEDYSTRVRKLYQGRVPGGADFVCYWFAKCHEKMKSDKLHRAGLVSTNSIRNGKSRDILKVIVEDMRIFDAWSDEPWINEGAELRVSMTCFSNSNLPARLNGIFVEQIYSNLEAATEATKTDFTAAKKLIANKGVCFVGVILNGNYEVAPETVRNWLTEPKNINGKPNSDVLKRTLNGDDFNSRREEKWIIDFGTSISETDASHFEKPFEYILHEVKPFRQRKKENGEFAVRAKNEREKWWLHARPRPAMRKALQGLTRYIAIPMVSSYRTVGFLDASYIPDQKLVVFARDDCFFLGILQSKAHYLWTLKQCSWIGAGNDMTYSNQAVFETFPFPAGMEPNRDAAEYSANPKATAIAAAAQRLNELRENWLNPADLVKRVPEVVPGYPDRILPVSDEAEAILKKRTLTNLYNEKPAWLQNAHKELDNAVADAYGWPHDLSDEEILENLFTLNQERAEHAN